MGRDEPRERYVAVKLEDARLLHAQTFHDVEFFPLDNKVSEVGQKKYELLSYRTGASFSLENFIAQSLLYLASQVKKVVHRDTHSTGTTHALMWF